MNIYTTLSKLSLTIRYSWDAQIISNLNRPKGRLIFSGKACPVAPADGTGVRRRKKGFVCANLCASAANKNIYLFIPVCPVGRADDTGVPQAKLPSKREQAGR